MRFLENIFGKRPALEISDTEKQKTEARTRRKYESPPSIKEPQEDVLASREKKSAKRIGRGVTGAEFVELKDDGKGVFKTQDYQNERAAYLIDRFLGFKLVPPTVIRQIERDVGSMQGFIADASMACEVRMGEEYAPERIKMWLFDVMIGNTDRHEGNFLVKKDDKKIYAIDHGYSLGFNSSFTKTMSFDLGDARFFDRELSEEIVTQMKKFLENKDNQGILEDLLMELLGKEVASAALKRICYVAKLVAEKKSTPSWMEVERGVDLATL